MLDKEHKVSIPGTGVRAGGEGGEGEGGKEKDAYTTTLQECE